MAYDSLLEKSLLIFSLLQCLLNLKAVVVSLVVSIFSAILGWGLCGFTMWLWNRAFRRRFRHHLLCAAAALITGPGIFCFLMLGEMNYYGDKDMNDCRDFVKFTKPSSATADATPEKQEQSVEAQVKGYFDGWLGNFRSSHPFVNQRLAALESNLVQNLQTDFSSHSTADANDSVSGEPWQAWAEAWLSAVQLEMDAQIARLRLWIMGCVLFVQLIAIGYGNYSAYQNLKPGKM